MYARDAFGDFGGFLTAWSYWVTAWAGNAAIVVAWVGYVEVFWNKGHSTGWSIALAIAGLWIPAIVNLSGVRNIGAAQLVTTVVKFIPLLFMATVGLLFIKAGNFGAFNASGNLGRWRDLRGGRDRAVRLPRRSRPRRSPPAGSATRSRNVARATVLGTIGCAVIYILGTVTVFGTGAERGVAAVLGAVHRLRERDLRRAVGGRGGRGGRDRVRLGALVGWTLIVAEMSQAAARDRLFPAPFARESGRGVPAIGIVVGTSLASILTVVSYSSFAKVFLTIVLLSVFTSVIPYLFSAAAQLYWLLTRGRSTAWPHLVRDVGVSALALVFTFWSLAGTGYQAAYYGVICLFLGVPVYMWMKVGRREYGETLVIPIELPAPEPPVDPQLTTEPTVELPPLAGATRS